MAHCGNCSGSGTSKSRCFSCRGTGAKPRLRANGTIDNSSCIVCAGTGKTSKVCMVCQGKGIIGKIVTPPPFNPKKTFQDPLEGRWYNNKGEYYEFKKIENEDIKYLVAEYGAIGQSATGIGTFYQNKIYFDMQNRFFGKIQFILNVNENQMFGHIEIFGQVASLFFVRR